MLIPKCIQNGSNKIKKKNDEMDNNNNNPNLKNRRIEKEE